MLDLGFKLSIMPVVPLSCYWLALLASVSDELLLRVSSDVSWKWAFKRKRMKISHYLPSLGIRLLQMLWE